MGGAPPAQAHEATAIPPGGDTGKDSRKAVLGPLPLEWTQMGGNNEDFDKNPANVVRYPWDVMDIDANETFLSSVGTAGQKITRMGRDLQKFVSPNLTELVLRSHLIRTMEGIAGMKHLEFLELYDNMVDELRELGGPTVEEEKEEGKDGEDKEREGLPGRSLKVFDISYNSIRDMEPVCFCPNLQELYIAQNKIKSIKGLKYLKHLRKVDLGANRIRVIDEEELSGLVHLEELWLGKNKIERISGLSKLTKLRRLDIQSNRLTKIENLGALVDTLEELYLAHNGIDNEGAKCESGLALPFTQLNTVDMSRNRLTDTSPFSHLTSLTDLWISGNKIETFKDVDHLQELTKLDTLYMEYNPVASEFEYRMKLKQMVPSLAQIDANQIASEGYAPVGVSGSSSDLVAKMKLMQTAAIEKAKLTEEKLRNPEAVKNDRKPDEETAEETKTETETNDGKIITDEKNVEAKPDEREAQTEAVDQISASGTNELSDIVKPEESE